MLGNARPLTGYGIAAAASAVAYGVSWATEGASVVGAMVTAVLVATWLAGLRPGLLAALVSFPAVLYFLPPNGSWAVEVAHLPRIGYYVVFSAFCIWAVITSRRTSETLRHSEQALRLAIDTMPVMAWTLSPDGRLEFLNRRWLEYSGIAQDEALADGTRTIHPDDRERAVDKWRRAQVTAEAYEDEIRLRRADGEYRWFLVRTVPLRGDDGAIVRWYGTSTDIEDRKRAETERRRAEQALRESAARLQHLSRRLLEVQEEERRHLARELHDELGQILASINLRLHAAKSADGAAAQLNLVESIALVQRAGERARSLVLKLRPTILESSGLDGTLRWLAEQHRQQTRVPTEVLGRLGEVAPDIATACFRVVQEGLTNTLRHAQARHVWIELRQDERALEILLRDDGAGFEAGRVVEEAPWLGHVGLLGMRERVEILGGELQIESAPGRGTRIRVAFAATLAQPAVPAA